MFEMVDTLTIGDSEIVRGSADVGQIGVGDDTFAQLLMWNELKKTLDVLRQRL